MEMSPETKITICAEFQRMMEMREIKLNKDILSFLAHSYETFNRQSALNTQGPFRRSLIHYAAMGDCTELLEILLRNGAAKDERDQNKRTPLSWAAEHGALGATKILLGRGAKINSTDDMRETPLGWLIHAGEPSDQLARTEAFLRDRGAREKGSKRRWVLRKIRML